MGDRKRPLRRVESDYVGMAHPGGLGLGTNLPDYPQLLQSTRKLGLPKLGILALVCPQNSSSEP